MLSNHEITEALSALIEGLEEVRTSALNLEVAFGNLAVFTREIGDRTTLLEKNWE